MSPPPGLRRSEWIQLGNSGLPLLGGDPGNAILLNGVTQPAHLEIGAPGFQSQVPKSISEFRLNTRGPKHARSSRSGWQDSIGETARVE